MEMVLKENFKPFIYFLLLVKLTEKFKQPYFSILVHANSGFC